MIYPVRIVCSCTGQYQEHTRRLRDIVEVDGYSFRRWAWYCNRCGRMQGKED